MNIPFLALGIATLTACSAPKPPPYPTEVLPKASTIYPSPDGRMFATLRYGKQPFTVAIIERESGQVRGVARSSVKLSEDGEHMHGEVRVTYADNLSIIVVREDFCDTMPNPRYILFQRKLGGVDYRVFYCAPPTAHTNSEVFDYVYPNITHVSSESLTLEYPGEPDATRVLAIKDLVKTGTPKSAEEIPSGFNEF